MGFLGATSADTDLFQVIPCKRSCNPQRALGSLGSPCCHGTGLHEGSLLCGGLHGDASRPDVVIVVLGDTSVEERGIVHVSQNPYRRSFRNPEALNSSDLRATCPPNDRQSGRTPGHRRSSAPQARLAKQQDNSSNTNKKIIVVVVVVVVVGLILIVVIVVIIIVGTVIQTVIVIRTAIILILGVARIALHEVALSVP